ncbi:hypothetical protein ABIE62_002686 [Porphyrobacter sp. MBR-155]|uniref:hypothetical protein n=1 Tax=Porphyrobacter sp. MBR-155 TaxID=3156464 RepID=UPI0015593DA8
MPPPLPLIHAFGILRAYVRDFQPLRARQFKVAFAVATWIDHRGLAARADEVGQVGQTGRLDFFEQHIVSLHSKKRDRREPIPLLKKFK